MADPQSQDPAGSTAGQGEGEATSAASLSLSELIGALSYALDLTEGQPPGHCLRCCWIGVHTGGQLGLEANDLWDLYYALLLKDAGCSSNAARLYELYGTDDRTTKCDFKVVDSQSILQITRFVMGHAGVGRGLGERLGRILNLAAHGEALTQELITTRCERGGDIARQLGFGEGVAKAIRCLDEHWNGKGRPGGLAGRFIPLGSRIALLAQVVDVFHAVGGPEHACDEVSGRSGKWFDPEVVGAFQAASRQPGFWEGLQAQNLELRVRMLEPRSRAIEVDDDRLDDIAAAFAGVVDAKSPFTFGHSTRVAFYADAVSQQLGLPAARRRWLRRGALLHDIGKLGVSNAILDKPGKLTALEWEQVKAHPRYTEEILSRIGPFAELARVAGAHHERIDGQGYHRGLSGDCISVETRIITVADIFDAITAERPYRPANPVEETLAIMDKEAGTHIDADCLAALKHCLPDILPEDQLA